MWKRLLLLGCLVCLATARHTRNKDNRGESSGQVSEQHGRHIVIRNRGKIVNNGISERRQGTLGGIIHIDEDSDVQLERLGYKRTLDDSADMETLLKQKFLLDVLLNVNGNLLDEKLLELGETLVVDESSFQGLIDDDMLQLLQLAINGQALTKNQQFNGLDPQHRRQLNGLRKLLVQAKDWDTFQRLVCFAREHFNGVLVANALILAVPEREDTREMIVPAISEIIPKEFLTHEVAENFQNIDLQHLITDTATLKPNLKDLIDLGRINIQQEQRPQSSPIVRGGWGAGQPKKTWQEWKAEKMLSQRTHAGNLGDLAIKAELLGKVVLPLAEADNARAVNTLNQRIAYFTEDLGLNNFWYGVYIDGLTKVGSEQTTRRDQASNNRNIGIGKTDSIPTQQQQNSEGENVNQQDSERLLHINRRRLSQRVGGQSNQNTKDITGQRGHQRSILDSLEEEMSNDERRHQQRIQDSDEESDEDISKRNIGIKQQLRGEERNTDNQGSGRILHVNRRRLSQRVGGQSNQNPRDITGQRGNQRSILDSLEEEMSNDERRHQQRIQDSDEESDEDINKRNIGINQQIRGEEQNTDNQGSGRILHVNRRRLSQRVGGQSNQNQRDITGQRGNQRSILDSLEEEMSNDERRRQQRIQDSDEESDEDISLNSIKQQLRGEERNTDNQDSGRILHVNRRRLNQRVGGQSNQNPRDITGQRGNQRSILDSLEEEMSNDERRHQQRIQDSDEESDEDISKRNIGIKQQLRGEEQNTDNQDSGRILHVNRRRLSQRVGGQSNQNPRDITGQRGNQRSILDSLEEEMSNDERRRQQRIQDSDEESDEDISLNSIKQQLRGEERNTDNQDSGRILHVNRRRLNQRVGGQSNQNPRDITGQRGNQRSILDSLEEEMSNDERRHQQRIQDSDEESDEDISKRNIGIKQQLRGEEQNTDNQDSGRILHVNRRRLSQRVGGQSNQNPRDIAGQKKNQRSILDSLEEEMSNDERRHQQRIQDSDEESDEDISKTNIGIKQQIRGAEQNTDNQGSGRILHVNRRRLSQRVGGQSNQNQRDITGQRGNQRSILNSLEEEMSNDERRRQQRIRNVDNEEQEAGVNSLRNKISRNEENGQEIGGRKPRSIVDAQNNKNDIRQLRAGEISIQNKLQILIRLKLERLSHTLEDLISVQGVEAQTEEKRNLKQQDGEGHKGYQKDISQEEYVRALKQIDNLKNQIEGEELQQRLENLENIWRKVVKDGLNNLKTLQQQGKVQLDNESVRNIIGDILLHKITNTEVVPRELWSQLGQAIQAVLQANSAQRQAAQSAHQLQDPLQTVLMEIASKIINEQIDALPGYRQEDILARGISVNEVKVDKLQTYLSNIDSDLINLLDLEGQLRTGEDIGKLRKQIVARQLSLNHKSFSIDLDVNSDRTQNVVVRILLGPKLDVATNVEDLNKIRENFLQLDAFATTLTSGRNVITRKSSDIGQAAAEATTYTQLYRDVMQAIDGNRRLQLSASRRSNCRIPNRLLLPRGLPQGLPMQILVVVTPQTEQDLTLKQLFPDELVCGLGLSTVNLDSLPLSFPLDRPISKLNNILVPNVLLKNVLIYHDEKSERDNKTVPTNFIESSF